MVWVALLLAPALGGGLPELLTQLTEALEHPFAIRWTERSALTILLCVAAYAAVLTVLDAENSQKRDGEEHGSAQWGLPRQVNATFAQKNKPCCWNAKAGTRPRTGAWTRQSSL